MEARAPGWGVPPPLGVGSRVRGADSQAPGDEVALPHRQLFPGLPLNQGRPAALAHPARVRALPQAVPLPRGR